MTDGYRYVAEWLGKGPQSLLRRFESFRNNFHGKQLFTG